MNLGLNGKRVLLTGASSGIGAAAARLFAEEGADVFVGYGRNAKGAERTAGSVREAGARAWLLQMDVADPASVAAAMQRLADTGESLDAVVLCAGRNKVTPFDALTHEEWNQIITTNLSGTFYVMQAVLPYLNDHAAIVTVASVAAHTGAPHHAHYAAAKAGIVNLTKSAARALAPRVRVNCIAPGITLTEMGTETAATLDADYAEKKLPAQRFADPDEIARWVVFLASPAAGFVYGATIDVNGGRTLR